MDARRAALGFADDAEMQAALQRRAMVEEAFELREAGVDPNTVSDALVLGLKGEEGFTLRDAALFALSVAPVTGNVMAAHASVEAGQTLLDAIDAEDWDSAQEAGIALGIEIFGLLPGIGGALSKAAKAAKAARTGNNAGEAGASLLTRSIENVRRRYDASKNEWKKLKAQAELHVAYKQGEQGKLKESYPHTSGDRIFGRSISQDTWDAIKKTHGESIEATMYNRVSEGQESHIAQLLEDAGATLRGDHPGDKKFNHSNHGGYNRTYDAVIDEDLVSEDGFLVPRPWQADKDAPPQAQRPEDGEPPHVKLEDDGEPPEQPQTEGTSPPQGGTGIEVKYDAGPWKKEQREFDNDVTKAEPATNTENHSQEIFSAKLLRQHMHQIPLETLRPALGQVLRKPKYGISEEEVATLLKGLDDFHRKERKARNGVPFEVFVRIHWNTFKKLFEDPKAPKAKSLPTP